MATTTSKPGKFWAYVAVFVGGLLLLSGAAAAIGYLGLPFLTFGEDILGPRLGQMGGMFLGLVGGGLAVYHGLGSIRNRASRPLKLPPFYLFLIVFAVVLGLGNVLLNFHVVEAFLFPPLFLLGAALPTVAVLSWAGRRLNCPATWRQGALSLVSGSTLSILVTILLGSVLPLLVYLLIGPLAYALLASWGTPGFLLSPEILFFVVFVALQAPIPEEFAKALGPGLMIRRLTSERQAFFVGLASGAGFAILENMVYEGVYAQWSGWTWGGITLLRAIGSVLHPLGTGIIALALFRTRERPTGWFGQLARAYLLSVGLHTLWNGGFEFFVYLTGVSLYTGSKLDFYGEAVGVLLVVFLVALSAGLWWLLWKIVRELAASTGEVTVEGIPLPEISPRALAVWAFACALVVIPIGAALSPAWGQIQAAVLAGPPTPTPTAPPTATPTPTPDLAATQQAQRNQEATATVQAVQATAVAASQWPIVLSDSFDANVNDWPTGEHSSERVTGKRLIIGKYRWEAKALKGVVWLSQPDVDPVSDFYLTVEARRSSGPEYSQYGLVFRRVDRDNNYYLFTIRDAPQRFRLALRYEGEWETVIVWTKTSAIRPNEVNRLTVIAEGSHFLFFINDQYVGEANDSRLSSGKAGLAIDYAGDEAIFEFDNFELRAPELR